MKIAITRTEAIRTVKTALDNADKSHGVRLTRAHARAIKYLLKNTKATFATVPVGAIPKEQENG